MHRLYAEIAPHAPSRFLLMREGDLGWKGTKEFLTPETAERIIAAFREAGNKLPIDYHHQTSDVESGERDKAPAAGFIGGLEYVPGEGLFATAVEWTADAAREIAAGQYRYVSPEILLSRATRQMMELHSCALTNRPRTRNMPELLSQAAEAVRKAAETKPKRTKKAQGEIHDDEATAMSTLINMLGLAEDASLMDIISAAIDKLKEQVPAATPEAEAEAKEKQMALEAQIKTLTEKNTALEAEVTKLKAVESAADGMKKQLASLEQKEADRAKAEKAATVKKLVQEQIDAGRILPDDEKAVGAATKLAELDVEQFRAVYETLPVILPPGRITPREGGPRNDRERTIRKAAESYERSSKLCSKKGYINGELEREGQDRLSKTELDALKIGV